MISLVIYNSKKPRKELIRDYTIVGIVQLAALVYGVYVMSSSRPVYVARVKDRLEVVTPADIEPAEREAAKDARYRSLPKLGACVCRDTRSARRSRGRRKRRFLFDVRLTDHRSFVRDSLDGIRYQ